jgi:hypothetical protein
MNLSRDLGVEPDQLPVMEYVINVKSRGNTLHEAFAGMSGSAYATSTPGVIPNSMLSGLDAGLLDQVYNAVLPSRATAPTTYVECMAMGLEAGNGVIKTAPIIALVTDKVQMISSGQMQLDNGKLDLSFENYPNQAYQANVSEVLVNPFIKFSGTLAQPKMALDAPRALLFSGLAVGTGGLSILAKGLLDRLRRDATPCDKYIAMVTTANED